MLDWAGSHPPIIRYFFMPATSPTHLQTATWLNPVRSKRLTPDLLGGQKALVTGASSWIGKAIAIALAEAGADIAVNFPASEAEAHEVGAQISRAGRKAILVQA